MYIQKTIERKLQGGQNTKSALNLESEKKINKTLNNTMRKRKCVSSKNKYGEKHRKKKDKWKNIERRRVTLEVWINVV